MMLLYFLTKLFINKYEMLLIILIHLNWYYTISGKNFDFGNFSGENKIIRLPYKYYDFKYKTRLVCIVRLH